MVRWTKSARLPETESRSGAGPVGADSVFEVTVITSGCVSGLLLKSRSELVSKQEAEPRWAWFALRDRNSCSFGADRESVLTAVPR